MDSQTAETAAILVEMEQGGKRSKRLRSRTVHSSHLQPALIEPEPEPTANPREKTST